MRRILFYAGSLSRGRVPGSRKAAAVRRPLAGRAPTPPRRHMTASAIVGRNAELGAIDVFLNRLACGPAAMVFEGLAGIG